MVLISYFEENWGHTSCHERFRGFGVAQTFSATIPKVAFSVSLANRLVAASTDLCQLTVVPSRHPGRYPKLEDFTLPHPALEPLTERHALRRACDRKGKPLRLRSQG